VEAFKRRLQDQLPGLKVKAEGLVDVDVKTVEKDALGRVESIAADLRAKGVVKLPSLGWTITLIKGRPALTTAITSSDPYKQAEELRYHPFTDARQFTTQAPFMLIFSYLPRLNLFLHDDSSGLNEKFFRSLARRAFIQLHSDGGPCN